MVRNLVLSFVLASILAACGGEVKQSVQTLPGGGIVKASANSMPAWVLQPKKDPTNVYFTGMSGRSPDLKTAKQASVQNAIGQLVDFIGLRATHEMSAERRMEDMDNVSSFKKTIVDTIEGRSSADVSVDVDDIYYEQYSDGTYIVYSEIKFPKDWVQDQRNKLAKLVADQRQKASDLLADASDAMKSADIARAIDDAVNAMVIAEKAGENSDLYDDSKAKLTLCLSGLAFRLDNTPKYAYSGGGSDEIRVLALYGDKPQKGIPVIASEKNGNASLVSSTGGVSDGNGMTSFGVSKVKGAVSNLTLRFTIGMQKFEAVQRIDPKFYEELEGLQKSQNLDIPLGVGDEAKVKPTTVLFLDLSADHDGQMKVSAAMKTAGALSVVLNQAGYNIQSLDIPGSILKKAGMDDTFRDSVLEYISTHQPAIKRVFWCMRTITDLGKTEQGMEVVSTRVIISLVDIATRKENKGLAMTVKGFDNNTKSGAIDYAEKELPKEFAKKLAEF
jgi:hypothetical protein